MLSKKHRLSSFAFDTLNKSGKLYSQPYFNIKYLHSPTHLKVSVVVSKKVSPKAVERNKLKRLIYQVIGNTTPLNTNIQIIIFTKPQLRELKSNQLETLFREFFTSI